MFHDCLLWLAYVRDLREIAAELVVKVLSDPKPDEHSSEQEDLAGTGLLNTDQEYDQEYDSEMENNSVAHDEASNEQDTNNTDVSEDAASNDPMNMTPTPTIMWILSILCWQSFVLPQILLWLIQTQTHRMLLMITTITMLMIILMWSLINTTLPNLDTPLINVDMTVMFGMKPLRCSNHLLYTFNQHIQWIYSTVHSALETLGHLKVCSNMKGHMSKWNTFA